MRYLKYFLSIKSLWIIGFLLIASHRVTAQAPIGLPVMDSLLVRASYYRANVYIDSSLYYYKQMATRALSEFETRVNRMDTIDREKYAIAYLRGMDGMAFCRLLAGDYDQSLTLVNQGIEFYRQSRQTFYIVMANLLIQKAEVYIFLNNYTMAFDQYTMVLQGLVSLSMHGSLSPTENYLITRCLNDMGRMRYYEDRRKDAILLFEQVRDVLHKNMTAHRDTSLLISANILLSDCYELSERMEESKQVLMEAAWLCNAKLYASRSIQEQMIMINTNLGDLFRQELDYDVAFDYYLKAEKLAKEIYRINNNPNFHEVELLFVIETEKVIILNAKKEYRKALDVAYVALGNPNLRRFDVDYTPIHTIMSSVYENIGMLDSAEYWAKAALKHYNQFSNPALKTNLALIFVKRGALNEANLLVDSVLSAYVEDSSQLKRSYLNYDLRKSQVNHDHQTLIQCLGIKALILSDQKQYHKALELYKACLIWGDTLIQSSGTYMSYLRYAKLIHNITRRGIELCLQLGMEQEAFHFLERATSILSRRMRQVDLAAEQAGVPLKLIQRKKELTSIMQQHSRILTSNDQKIFLTYQSEYDSLSRIIQKYYPVYIALSKQILLTTPEQINAHLTQHPHTAFSSFLCSDSVTYQFLFTKKHFEILSIPIGADSLKRLVKDFQTSICHPLTKSSELTVLKRTGEQLFRLLIAPAESLFHAQGIVIKNWVIVPDQQLHYLSFPALVRPCSTASFRDLAYVVKDYCFTQASSATLWIRESQIKPIEYSGLLTVVGYFDRKSSSKKLTNRDLQPLFQNCGLPCHSLAITIPDQDSVSVMRGNSFLPLNYALPQSEFSKKLFQYYRLPCIGIQDTLQMKKSLVQTIRNHPDHIIQFISHGKVNKNDPLRTCLYLYDTKYGRDSLTALEVMALPVRSRLVVFSACETGIDRIADGEGMEGMVQAWRFAGAQNILASLGEINDRATAAFMLYFYRQMLENPKQPLSLVLQKTQNYMIQTSYFTEPVFWAQFKLIGSE